MDDLLERLDNESANWSATCGDLFAEAKREIERLRDGLHVARGALLCIGTPYAKEVADALAPVLDPALAGHEQTRQPSDTASGQTP